MVGPSFSSLLSPALLTALLSFSPRSLCISRFARLAATTFISQGIPVYLFSDITPTPFVVSVCFYNFLSQDQGWNMARFYHL